MKKGVFIVVAAAVAAVVFYGVRYVRMPVDVLTAHAQTKESRIVSEGIIVYSESVYTAAKTGTFYSYTGDGERVGKNRLLAAVYDGIVDKEVLQSLGNIDKKIADIEEDNKKTEVFVSDASSKQAVIENVKSDIINAVIEGDVSGMSDYKNKLKSTTGAGVQSNNDMTLGELQAEKRKIEAGITQGKSDIYSAMSGIYTTALDGLEGMIKPEELTLYNVETYRNLAEPVQGVVGNRTVKKDEAVCKVVDNHVWYVATVIKKEDVDRIKVGDSVHLRVSELPGDIVEAKIYYISTEGEGAEEYLAVVACERYLEGVFNIRKSNIEIILNSYYGFEIPVYAIHVKDGKNGVMVRTGNSEVFKECEILNRNDETGMVIVSPSGDGSELSDGDKIILGEK